MGLTWSSESPNTLEQERLAEISRLEEIRANRLKQESNQTKNIEALENATVLKVGGKRQQKNQKKQLKKAARIPDKTTSPKRQAESPISSPPLKHKPVQKPTVNKQVSKPESKPIIQEPVIDQRQISSTKLFEILNDIEAITNSDASKKAFECELTYKGDKVILTEKSKDFLFYEESLLRLIERLDGVDTCSDDSLRSERKRLVLTVMGLLKQVDLYRNQ